MTDKQILLIEKAVEIFSRYGVRRTTMGDIADHVGVSRQTLYATYKNKDEVLVAAVRHVADQTIKDIGEAWEKCTSIEEKLDAYLELAVIRHFVVISQMPDANDLQTGFSESGSAELRVAELKKVEMLATLFQPFEARLTALGSSPQLVSEFFQSASSSSKFAIKELPELKQILNSLKLSTMVLLGES